MMNPTNHRIELQPANRSHPKAGGDVHATSVLRVILLLVLSLDALSRDLCAQNDAMPTNNPVAHYGLDWTGEFPWQRVVSITSYPGQTWNVRFVAAQADLVARGGGVIFFPAGDYELNDSLVLDSHIVLRGDAPRIRGQRGEIITRARDLPYRPSTRLRFPAYKPVNEGDGTPVSSAFKGIRLRDENRTTHCGVLLMDIDRGHIHFGCDVYNAHSFTNAFANYGRNHIVFGCRLTHAARQDPRLPREWQHPWQRWTHRHGAVIDIRAAANVLVANNQIPESEDSGFAMPGFRIRVGNRREPWRPGTPPPLDVGVRDDIVFRYDNRPGIYVNYTAVTGTPETHPYGFAPGIEIRENYVFNYGCLAIGFSGNGTRCLSNTIRYKPNAYLPIFDGETDSHFTNNNRPIEARGWAWTIAYNDYEVYSNTQFDKSQFGGHYGDCEGIMHEAHSNCDIRDSKLLYNVGNRYLCIWRVPVTNLEIRGNIIRVAPYSEADKPAIAIQGQVHRGNTLHPLRNVHIIDNILEGGIRLHGEDAGGNIVRGNRNISPRAEPLENTLPGAVIEDNHNLIPTDRIRYR